MTKKSLLLVDDERGLRKVLGITLEDMGYDVHLAASGEEALELFSQVRPDIVLTDIKMPGMDGIELLRELKALDAETEVIMITGHGDMALAVESLQHDACDFVTKPIGDEELRIALNRAFERREMRRQIREYTENLELLVEQKTQELLESERLAAVGQTVAGLAHAIKNIAGGLEGGMFVVEKGFELQDEEYLRQGWDMIGRDVRRIKDLSLDLLNIAGPVRLKPESCDPNLPAREVVELMRPVATELGVEIRAELMSGLPHVVFDKEGIHKCLLNIVANAVEAFADLPEDGRKREIAVSSSAEDGWGVVYRIRDTGCGMEEETLKKVFSSFFSTKGMRGTGIGLMLAQKIVEEHGGEITASSRPGEGAEFRVCLPGTATADAEP